MTEPKGYAYAHGAWFGVVGTHTRGCSYCRHAQDVAEAHMRDANLKSTKYTTHDGFGEPHVVTLTRIARNSPMGPLPKFATGGYIAMPKADIDLSDTGLSAYAAKPTTTLNELKLIYEVTNLRLKLERQRPVVLDLEEGEAALVLRLLDMEQEDKEATADGHYQNGSGFEGECAQARQEAEEADKLGDRLRDVLSKYLDKAYTGELGL